MIPKEVNMPSPESSSTPIPSVAQSVTTERRKLPIESIFSNPKESATSEQPSFFSSISSRASAAAAAAKEKASYSAATASEAAGGFKRQLSGLADRAKTRFSPPKPQEQQEQTEQQKKEAEYKSLFKY